MRAALERCGYIICRRVIFSDEMAGVPQRRERLYIAAFRDADSAASFEWPAAVFNAHGHDDTAASGAGVDGGGEKCDLARQNGFAQVTAIKGSIGQTGRA